MLISCGGVYIWPGAEDFVGASEKEKDMLICICPLTDAKVHRHGEL